MFIDDLINSIYQIEGSSSPNSVNQHMIKDYGLYDPGHLVFANQTGAVPVKINGVTWAGFSSIDAANQAMANQINLDASRGHTVESFISKYAPSFENDTNSYIATVSSWLGVSKGSKLSDLISGTNSSIDTSSNDAIWNFDGFPDLTDLFSSNGSGTSSSNDNSNIGVTFGIAGVVVLAYLALR